MNKKPNPEVVLNPLTAPLRSPAASAVLGVGVLPVVAEAAAGVAGDTRGPVPLLPEPGKVARSSRLHPLSNTGCITPSSEGERGPHPVLFHHDYLTLTLHPTAFATNDDLAQALMWVFSEKLWPRFSDVGLSEWIDRGPARHWGQLWQLLPGVTIRVPSSPDERYISLELKGEAFTWLGEDDLMEMFAWFGKLCQGDLLSRVACTRVDYAFDHVAISPREMFQWFESGAARSKGFARCKGGKPDASWKTNGEGDTFYLKSGPRLLRLYNRRGYNRLELELTGDHAKEAFSITQAISPEKWGEHAIARLRGFVDFVNPKSSDRLERATLLQKWSDLVTDVSPARLQPRKVVESNATPAGKFNVKGARMKKTLAQLLHALGPDDFARYCTNLARAGLSDLTPSEKVEAEALPAWRSFLDHYTYADEVEESPPF